MRQKVNKRRIILILLVALLLVCGSVAAFMIRQTPAVTNEFDKAYVACEAYETFSDNQKTSITVTNTGNIDAYLRVKIISHWEDAKGTIVAKASVKPSFTLGDGWLTDGNGTYYYTTPVKSQASTGNLLSSPIVLGTEDGYYQVVEVFAEAIQAEPAKAAADSWGLSINDKGTVTAIK